jgi:cell division transport system permease protein
VRAEYLIAEAAANLRRNILLVVGAILALFISLLMTYMGLIVNEMARKSTIRFQEGITIIGWLDDASLTEHSTIQAEIDSWSEVRRTQYVSKAEAWEEFKDLFEDNPALVEEVDPSAMPASVRIELENNELHDAVVSRLARVPGIDEVAQQPDEVEAALKTSEGLRLLMLIIGTVLGVSAIVMISNTVRMAIYARREEIGIMKLVGASNWFVRTPFLLEGMVEGLVGGGLALLAGWFGYRTYIRDLDFGLIETTVADSFLLSRGLLVLVFGVAMGIVGSLFGIHRYLRESA